MGCLGNLIWLLCGGLFQSAAWLLAGLLWCITIVGAPIGLQCFKFAGLAFAPLAKRWCTAGAWCLCWPTFCGSSSAGCRWLLRPL